jgi:hypothetical protein
MIPMLDGPMMTETQRVQCKGYHIPVLAILPDGPIPHHARGPRVPRGPRVSDQFNLQVYGQDAFHIDVLLYWLITKAGARTDYPL